jgi:hypothetical protein
MNANKFKLRCKSWLSWLASLVFATHAAHALSLEPEKPNYARYYAQADWVAKVKVLDIGPAETLSPQPNSPAGAQKIVMVQAWVEVMALYRGQLSPETKQIRNVPAQRVVLSFTPKISAQFYMFVYNHALDPAPQNTVLGESHQILFYEGAIPVSDLKKYDDAFLDRFPPHQRRKGALTIAYYLHKQNPTADHATAPLMLVSSDIAKTQYPFKVMRYSEIDPNAKPTKYRQVSNLLSVGVINVPAGSYALALQLASGELCVLKNAQPVTISNGGETVLNFDHSALALKLQNKTFVKETQCL